jgi:hypothetical protein
MFTEAGSPDVAVSAAQRLSGRLPSIHFGSRRAIRPSPVAGPRAFRETEGEELILTL